MTTATDLRPRPAIVSQVFLVLLTLLFLSPVVWAVLSSFKPAIEIIRDPLGFDPTAFTLDNFTGMFGHVPLASGFMNTAIVLVLKGGMILFLAPLAGYAFAKYDFPLKNLLFGTVLVTLTLPIIVLIIPLLLEMKEFGWINTYQALVLPDSFGLAFSIFWMRQVIASVPDELLDAARVDGCGEFGIFWRIVLPVIRPGLAGLAVLTFGAFGMAAPVAGGIGPFHVMVQGILLVYGVSKEAGIAYALVVHGAQTLLVVVMGGVSFVAVAAADKGNMLTEAEALADEPLTTINE